MIREAYKGRTFKIVKGRQKLHVRITVNGECFGEWTGSEAEQAEWVRRTIDAAEERPAAYGPMWAAKK